jgi:Protein of unknown function (DUF3027)
MARSTKRVCRDCGFFLPLDGSLGAVFGVCGNELSADGHVVDKQYGCGAHSDTPAPAGGGSPMYEPYDDGVLDVMEPPAEPPEPPAAPPEPLEAPAEPPVPPAEVLESVAESSEAAAELPAEVPEPPPEPPEPPADVPESPD